MYVMNKDERVEPGERDGAASQDARHKVRVKTARANRPGRDPRLIDIHSRTLGRVAW